METKSLFFMRVGDQGRQKKATPDVVSTKKKKDESSIWFASIISCSQWNIIVPRLVC